MKPAWLDDLARDLPRAVARGFAHVALAARADRPMADLEALADAGVLVVAARLSGDLTLVDVAARREQLRLLKLQIADAALLGATLAWLPSAGGAYFEEGVALLSAYAEARQVRLTTEAVEVVELG